MADTRIDNNFDFEFHSEVPLLENSYVEEAKIKLMKLYEREKDITGATVLVTKPAEASTPFLYQVKIVVDIKMGNIAAVKTGRTVQVALKSALKAVEKQVMAHKYRIHTPWKVQRAEQLQE